MSHRPVKPLNPVLYDGLVRAFGRVHVTNAGAAMLARYAPKFLEPGEELLIDSPGEYYLVCCPFCTDTRFRLWINHRWGARDEHGQRNLWLAHCYNEKCLVGNYERRMELYRRVSDLTAGPMLAAAILPGTRTAPLAPVPPGPVTRLDRLPADHPANRYLAMRGYDPERLAAAYGLGYVESAAHFWSASNRIYCPIHQNGKYAGWQCRYVGDPDFKAKGAPPKYFTLPGMQKGQMLWGLDLAVKYRTVVVVEGPFDRFNFGPQAVATLGFPPTADQLKLLANRFADKSVVLMPDPDVWKSPSFEKFMTQTVAGLTRPARFRGGLAVVRLPDGHDPGSLDAGFMKHYVAAEARGQGVKCDWNLV